MDVTITDTILFNQMLFNSLSLDNTGSIFVIKCYCAHLVFLLQYTLQKQTTSANKQHAWSGSLTIRWSSWWQPWRVITFVYHDLHITYQSSTTLNTFETTLLRLHRKLKVWVLKEKCMVSDVRSGVGFSLNGRSSIHVLQIWQQQNCART